MPIRHIKLALLLALVFLALAACAPSSVKEVERGSSSSVDRSFGDRVADQRLRSRIMNKVLNDNELLDDSHINVSVFNRVVLLTGEVPNAEAGRRLAAHVRGLDDTRRLHNELVVANMSSLMARSKDGLISSNARSRILRLKEPASLDADRVRVVTERNRLYLLGRVSRREADAITETVRRISGVREVVRMFEYTD